MTNLSALFKGKYHYFALSILTGILVGTTYIPFPAWALFFCYIPLWWGTLKAARDESLKFIFMMGWLAQFTLTLIGFNWIYYTAVEFGHLPTPLAALALLLFASLMHIYIPLALTFSVWLERKFNLGQTRLLFLIPLILSIAERAWPGIFQWNLGYTLLWMNWPLFQWADTVGFLGLSTIIFCAQAVLLYGALEFKKNRTKALSALTALLILLGGLFWGGGLKQKTWSETNAVARFTLVQGNIGNEEKLISELGRGFQKMVVDKYINLVDDYLIRRRTLDPDFKPDVILWPETALPLAFDEHYRERPLNIRVAEKARAWNTVVVSGAYSMDAVKRDHRGSPMTRNSVFFIGPNGPAAAPYFKSELLVFGEYMPLGQKFPFLYKLLPFVGTYEIGPGPVSKGIHLSTGQPLYLGPQICYESLDPGFSRGLAKAGAEIIFNITNDSWFGDWAEPFQHHTMTMARAIEARRPLVRSTNTGISSVILANGAQLAMSPLNRQWVETYDVKYLKNPPQSVYTRIGHWDWVVILMVIAFMLIRGRNEKPN